MARWFSEDPEYSEITPAEKAIRDRVVTLLEHYTQEMEGYSYYGSNPGISKDDYEDDYDAIQAAGLVAIRGE